MFTHHCIYLLMLYRGITSVEDTIQTQHGVYIVCQFCILCVVGVFRVSYVAVYT